MMNKAEILANYASNSLNFKSVVDDVVVVRTHNAQTGETIVVSWNRHGERLTFNAAHVVRPGKSNRKLRNASDATQWMERWASEAKKSSRKKIA